MATQSETSAAVVPVDMATINQTCRTVEGMRSGRLVYDKVASLHLLLRGHLAELLVTGHEVAERMPTGSFDRQRMLLRLDMLTQLHARQMPQTAGAGFLALQQLTRGCKWLMEQVAR